MALTSREQKIMILAIAAIVILISDSYIITPVLERRSEIKLQKETLQSDLEQSLSVLKRSKMLQQRWAGMKQAGLSYDIEATEGLLLRFLEDTSGNCGMLLTSIQPEHLSLQKQIGQIDFMVSGTGTMQAVTRFLWDIEMAKIPIKIESLQLGANDENASQMSLQLKLSSIYLSEAEKTEEQAS